MTDRTFTVEANCSYIRAFSHFDLEGLLEASMFLDSCLNFEFKPHSFQSSFLNIHPWTGVNDKQRLYGYYALNDMRLPHYSDLHTVRCGEEDPMLDTLGRADGISKLSHSEIVPRLLIQTPQRSYLYTRGC